MISTIGNCMSAGDTIANFASFEILPIRDISETPDETDITISSVEDMDLWGIYGRTRDGELQALHDTRTADEAARYLCRVVQSTGKPVAFEDRDIERIEADTAEDLAEFLTTRIHDDLPDTDADDFRDDDFDNHPLADIREALCAHSGYDGETTFTVIVTRDVTESVIVKVRASEREAVADKALALVWNTETPLNWETDDATSGDTYVTDIAFQ